MNSIERERATRAKAVKLLEKEGWKCWYPIRPGGKFRFPNSRTDIFGLFDLISVPKAANCPLVKNGMFAVPPQVRFIQLKTNHTGRIDDKYFDEVFMAMSKVSCEYWSYDTKKRQWSRFQLVWGKRNMKDYGV